MPPASAARLFQSFFALALILSLATLLGGNCSGTVSNGIVATPTGSVSIFITDAPSDEFDRILVTIERLELIGEDRKVTIFTGRETIDLKDLENFSDLFVYADGVPVGIYRKIRMSVTGIQLVREGRHGEVVDVDPPANGKIDLLPRDPFRIREGVTLVIELDMDARRSIHYVETGNGKFQFRPVVRTTIRETRSPTKLARVHGEVVEIFDDQSFDLCSTMFMASRDVASSSGSDDGGLGDRHRCLTVEWSDATGVFDSNGDPLTPDELMEEDEVTVVGRYHLVDANHDDPIAMPLDPSGATAAEHRVHEASAADGPDTYSKSTSKSKKKKSKKKKKDSDRPELDIVFIAYVIQIGPPGSFLALRGTVESDVVEDEFDFAIAPGQGFGDDSVVTALLQMGTAIFSKSGFALDDSDIVPDTNAVIDGVFMTDQTGTLYKTSLVVLDLEPELVDELRGEIAEVDRRDQSLTLRLDDDSEECVDVPEDVDVFLIREASDGVTSERGSFDDLRAGWRADVYGSFEIGFGCFTADTVIAFPSVIECLDGVECDELDFCSQSSCGEIGTCELRPELCTLESDIVCGCDGESYANECQANSAGTSVAHAGSCDIGGGACTAGGSPACGPGEFCLVDGGNCDDSALGLCVRLPMECPDAPKPVCGCDGRSYRNACQAARAGAVVESEGACLETVCGPGDVGCGDGEVCSIEPGRCDPRAEGVCVDRPDACPLVSDPVCGCDGKTHVNACLALREGVTVDFDGPCELPQRACGGANPACLPGEICSVEPGMCGEFAQGVCIPRPLECVGLDPVCGCDGKTYRNACEATRNGITVEARGVCASCSGEDDSLCGSGEVCLIEKGLCDPAAPGRCVERPTECLAESDPVCGCDGNTYANACLALQEGVPVAFAGSCGTKICGGSNPACSAGQLCSIAPGVCDPAAEGVCVDAPKDCPAVVKPVCGCDGRTYANACIAAKRGAVVEFGGVCSVASLCGGPSGVKCERGSACFVQPGVCEANAFGVCVAAPDACSDDARPVCGCDGVSYLNACRALRAGVAIASQGLCPRDG